MEINEINKKINNKELLTENEINYYLKCLNKQIKNDFNIEANPMQCKEIAFKVCYDYTRNFDQENFITVEFSTEDLKLEEITHLSSFLEFKTNNGYLCFIVDPTSIQFYTKNYHSNIGDINILDNLNTAQLNVLKELITNGYVKANINSLTNYINIFLAPLDISAGKKEFIRDKFIAFCYKYQIIQSSDNLIKKKK